MLVERNRQSLVWYRIVQVISWNVARFIFKRKIIRNEIKGKKGPFVVIANHQAAYDFINLIGVTSTPMVFVISNSFYNALPIKGILSRLGVIPKQQFQTTVQDMKRMKSVIDEGKPLVIYPAGLMCEDGLSTPIPTATYKFLKWLDADVYVARTYGTYFAMPKWAKGMRAGETRLDVYQLFTREQLAELNVDTIREKTEQALFFDAYREQEDLQVKYRENNNIEGLENVLYMCPHCKTEFSMRIRNKNTIFCENCGYTQQSDAYAFLHHWGEIGEEIRYVSDWSRLIYRELKEKIQQEGEIPLSAATQIHMLADKKNGFIHVGEGNLCLLRDRFVIKADIHGQMRELEIPTATFASLPFSPGKYLEIQDGKEIYRCVLDDGKLVMKFVNMVKIYYELKSVVKCGV